MELSTKSKNHQSENKKQRLTCFNKEDVRLEVHNKTDFPVPLSLPYIKHSTFPLFNSEPSRNKTEIDLSFQKNPKDTITFTHNIQQTTLHLPVT